MRYPLPACLLLCACLSAPLWAQSDDPPDVFGDELAKFVAQCASPVPEVRLAGVEGLEWLKYPGSEPCLLGPARDADASVRREVAFALSRVGGRDSLPVLAEMLGDGDAGVRRHARQSLDSLTQEPGLSADAVASLSPDAREDALLADLASDDASLRTRGLKALRCFASPRSEGGLLGFATRSDRPPTYEEETLLIDVLERVGGPASVPWLASVAERQPTACWALGAIGGAEAEEALLRGLGRFGTGNPQHVVNLDRIHSTRCGPFVPMLIQSYGCITYRGQPEDLAYEPTPAQRAITNLIIRSGRADEVVDLVLRELEGCPDDSAIAEDLRPSMVAMRDELGPGFVRGDGWVTSQPLSAMSHLVRDRSLAPRLVPLLDHGAFVPRVYVAMALGRLGAVEALPAITDLIEEGYPFADPVTAVSGKHFGDSQTVRWRSFLCMALGRMGGERARLKLEEYCRDPGQYRDIRYGAVVGLGFIGSEASLPVLRQVADTDIVWLIRVEAANAIHQIELGQAASADSGGDAR